MLDSETFRKEILKSVENMTVEIHAEMRLKASDGEPTPPVRVKVKRRPKGTPEGEEE